MALSSIIIDRIIDIALLFIFGSTGVLLLLAFYNIEILSTGVLLLIAAGLCVVLYIVFTRAILSAVLRPFFNILIPSSIREKVHGYYDDFFTGCGIFLRNRSGVATSIGIGVFSWIFPVLYGFFLASAIGIRLDPIFFIMVIPIISLIDLLPISISGIGTRDAVLIFLFGLQQLTPEQAIAFSLIYLFFSYWLIALVGALLWFRRPATLSAGAV
jgi:uncharacterized protein (TIRG00374 family)